MHTSKSTPRPRTIFHEEYDAQDMRLVGVKAPLRFPADAMRHNALQLEKISAEPILLLVLLDRGLVKGGFAIAQVLNRRLRGDSVRVVAYSKMSDADRQWYVEMIKKHARRYKWSNNMLAVELQYFEW
jgi:hypothetical protein